MTEAFTSINSFALHVKVSSRTIQRRIEKFNADNQKDHLKGVHDAITDVDLQNYLKKEFNLEDFKFEQSKKSALENVGVFTDESISLDSNTPEAEAEVWLNGDPNNKIPLSEYLVSEDDEIQQGSSKEVVWDVKKKELPIEMPFYNSKLAGTISEELAEAAKKSIEELDNQSNMEYDIYLKVKSKLEGSEYEISALQKRLSSDWLIGLVLVVILFADMIAFGIIGHHNFDKTIPFANIIFAVIGLATGIGSVVTYNRIKEFKLAEIWKWIFGTLQFCVFSFAINEKWFLAETIMTAMFVLVFIGVQRSIKK